MSKTSNMTLQQFAAGIGSGMTSYSLSTGEEAKGVGAMVYGTQRYFPASLPATVAVKDYVSEFGVYLEQPGAFLVAYRSPETGGVILMTYEVSMRVKDGVSIAMQYLSDTVYDFKTGKGFKLEPGVIRKIRRVRMWRKLLTLSMSNR